jgi:hypothetical protein
LPQPGFVHSRCLRFGSPKFSAAELSSYASKEARPRIHTDFSCQTRPQPTPSGPRSPTSRREPKSLPCVECFRSPKRIESSQAHRVLKVTRPSQLCRSCVPFVTKPCSTGTGAPTSGGWVKTLIPRPEDRFLRARHVQLMPS